MLWLLGGGGAAEGWVGLDQGWGMGVEGGEGEEETGTGFQSVCPGVVGGVGRAQEGAGWEAELALMWEEQQGGCCWWSLLDWAGWPGAWPGGTLP